MTTIQPMGARVLIRPAQKENKTNSGLILPETAKEKPQQGTVEAVGGEDALAATDHHLGIGRHHQQRPAHRRRRELWLPRRSGDGEDAAHPQSRGGRDRFIRRRPSLLHRRAGRVR